MIRYPLLILLITLSSCGIYRQNVVNAPLLEQKGQAQVSGHISFNGLEGQAAYALTGKIALLADYQNMGSKIDNNNNYFNKHTFREAGVGFYKKTETGKIREAFLMVGKGTSERKKIKPDSTGNLLLREVDYRRFVLQADFGNTRRKMEHVLSYRLLGVHYYDIFDNTSKEYKEISNFHIYGECAVTLRYPIQKFLMISGQACLTFPLKYSRGVNDYYEYSPINASIGLIFNTALLKP